MIYLVAIQRKQFDELSGYSIRARRGMESALIPRLRVIQIAWIFQHCWRNHKISHDIALVESKLKQFSRHSRFQRDYINVAINIRPGESARINNQMNL